MTYKDRICLERRRLRELNPNIHPFGDGWLKLSATARVNVCRRDGVYNEVAEKVLQSHCVGSEAAIEIAGTEPAPWSQQQKQLTLF